MFLINTIIDPRLMPNYPEYDYINNFSTHFNFDWQRVYGFAANSSILSTHLIVIFKVDIYLKQKRIKQEQKKWE